MNAVSLFGKWFHLKYLRNCRALMHNLIVTIIVNIFCYKSEIEYQLDYYECNWIEHKVNWVRES